MIKNKFDEVVECAIFTIDETVAACLAEIEEAVQSCRDAIASADQSKVRLGKRHANTLH